jgi:hypothetical protein
MPVSGPIHFPATLIPGKEAPQYPVSRMMGGAHGQSERFGRQNNLLSLPWIEPRCFGCPTRILVPVSTSVSRLSNTSKPEFKMSLKRLSTSVHKLKEHARVLCTCSIRSCPYSLVWDKHAAQAQKIGSLKGWGQLNSRSKRPNWRGCTSGLGPS